MDILKRFLYAFYQQEFETLSDPHLGWTIYFVVFFTLFLENGLLPAAFLPGDSLLILVGVLTTKGTLNFPIVILLLTVAASLGSWISYIQGKWLGNNHIVKKWLSYLPTYQHKRTRLMFYRHGFAALLLGRFIAFTRTLLPIIAGLSGLGSLRFHFFNWISAFLWVCILTLSGFFLGQTLFFQHYREILMLFLVVLPIVLLITGLLSLLMIIYRHKYSSSLNKTGKDEL